MLIETFSVIFKHRVNVFLIYFTFDFRWVFLSSNESIPFTHWQPKEPSNGNAGREDCVELGHGMYEPHRHLWNDESCYTQNKFICEITL